MTIEFIFGERESLMGKSEYYKQSVRKYLESLGFVQTTDSFIEGTFSDMVFFNPKLYPGKKFIIEAKAEDVTPKSKQFATELVTYFKLWNILSDNEKFEFWLFIQGVKQPNFWKGMFSEINDETIIKEWCEWYNLKYSEKNKIENDEKDTFKIFLSKATVKVASALKLDSAVMEKKKTSLLEIKRYGESLFKLTEKRRLPIYKNSTIITNILQIKAPPLYYTSEVILNDKQKIYDMFEGDFLPPFMFNKKNKIVTTFQNINDTKLIEIAKNEVYSRETIKLQKENPTFSSQLLHIHLRRYLWKKGVYRDSDAEIFYHPISDAEKKIKLINYTKKKVWVTKKYFHQKDDEYHQKGDLNFVRHKGFLLNTPTYWDNSYVEIVPKKYYTLNGRDTIDGKIRSKIDAKFRKSNWNRSTTKLRQIRVWKYYLFDSNIWPKEPEPWFKDFKFGDLITMKVGWCPMVLGREQTRLWDHFGGEV